MRFNIVQLDTIDYHLMWNEKPILLVSIFAFGHNVGCLKLFAVMTETLFFFIKLKILELVVIFIAQFFSQSLIVAIEKASVTSSCTVTQLSLG